ncbi:hypothetical protein OG241_35875 [Streptomyces sp. NBC_01390]|uniref:hypothetical protein n=1 Tax=Streptomyces sp. NBC_01390 TaxID=2903850 RepID=UPI003250BE51
MAWDAVGEWWPWALLALAGFNLLRSAVSVNSLIGPALLAGAALCGLALSRGLDTQAVQNLGVPLALAGSGIVLLLTARERDRRTRWTRVLSTGKAQVSVNSGELVILRALGGELAARFDAMRTPGDSTAVHVTVVAGHVRITVPQAWQVRVHASGTLLTRITETGRQDKNIATGPVAGVRTTPESGAAQETPPRHEVILHLLSVCGAISIVYV